MGKERSSKSWMAAAVPVKELSGRFGIDKCLEFIEEDGDRQGDIVVKIDQEPSIQFLAKDLIENGVSGETVPEDSLVTSSGVTG